MYGPFGLISAIFSLLSFLFWMAVIAVIVLFLIKIFSVNRYAEESVIERWSAVLPGQADRADTYLDRVDGILRAKKLPFASRRERIATSLTSGETYEHLVCEIAAAPDFLDTGLR